MMESTGKIGEQPRTTRIRRKKILTGWNRIDQETDFQNFPHFPVIPPADVLCRVFSGHGAAGRTTT
jgi:hypothetical protein